VGIAPIIVVDNIVNLCVLGDVLTQTAIAAAITLIAHIRTYAQFVEFIGFEVEARSKLVIIIDSVADTI
jgi:hypothetical protein